MMKDIKITLNDGSRIVGTQGFKKGKIDLIDKGVFSPCESKIQIKNFICPIWQIEGDKNPDLLFFKRGEGEIM